MHTKYTQAHNLGSPGIADTRPSATQQNPWECQHDLLLPKTLLPVGSIHCGGSWDVNMTIKHLGSINLPFPLVASHTHTPQPQPLALNVNNNKSHRFWDSYVKKRTETCWLCFCHHYYYLLSIGFCVVSWSFKVIACCKCRIQLLQSSADEALWENQKSSHQLQQFWRLRGSEIQTHSWAHRHSDSSIPSHPHPDHLTLLPNKLAQKTYVHFIYPLSDMQGVDQGCSQQGSQGQNNEVEVSMKATRMWINTWPLKPKHFCSMQRWVKITTDQLLTMFTILISPGVNQSQDLWHLHC